MNIEQYRYISHLMTCGYVPGKPIHMFIGDKIMPEDKRLKHYNVGSTFLEHQKTMSEEEDCKECIFVTTCCSDEEDKDASEAQKD